MAKKTNPPSIKETAFDCPHCGAYTTQYWFVLYARKLNDRHAPFIPDEEWFQSLDKDALERGEKQIPSKMEQMSDWYNKYKTGLVFFEKKSDKYSDCDVLNLFVSQCYNCKKITVWVHDNIVFPHERLGVEPNQDLPEDIIRDFEEARSIVDLSPRGAAALLRLSIQKLCRHLGEKGENINDDIKSLVSKGLNPLIQQSLDIVRVVGNEAVHPGELNLNDDRDTANRLFELVNSIADQMITHPKSIGELYEKLPPDKRKAIEKRNGKNYVN